jgi:hypothetical protein
VTDRPTTGGPPDPVEPTRIDISVAHPARVYDYILGGKDNFAVDRDAAEHMAAAFPGGFPGVKAVARAFRAFLGRTLRLSIDAGIRQFLDFGTGLPTGRRTHDVAQELAPESRVVYVDPDPLVLAHSHTLHTGTPEGATAYIQGELREADRVLEEAARTLDFSRPVAVRLYCLLNLETDPEQAYGVVERLMDAVVSGSHLVLATVCDDLLPEAMEVAQRLTDTTCETWVARSHAEVHRFFDGLELVEPGVVGINRWRVPEPDAVDQLIPIYGAVGRKP